MRRGKDVPRIGFDFEMMTDGAMSVTPQQGFDEGLRAG
jgi:hypothetical protein